MISVNNKIRKILLFTAVILVMSFVGQAFSDYSRQVLRIIEEGVSFSLVQEVPNEIETNDSVHDPEGSGEQEERAGGHFYPFSFILIELAIIIIVAIIGRWDSHNWRYKAF